MVELVLLALLLASNLFWVAVVWKQRQNLQEPRHLHIWDPWENTEIGNFVSGVFVMSNLGQRRMCSTCGERQIRRVETKR